jgi:hypothetical protein
VNPETNEFVYVPIPESRAMRPELATPYALVQAALAVFEARNAGAAPAHLRLPSELATANMHLDPDFERLRYGDSGTRRGKGLQELSPRDVVAFYGGLRPVLPCGHRLVYALVGLYCVAESVRVRSVPASRWPENAHTRCLDREGNDVVVKCQPWP